MIVTKHWHYLAYLGAMLAHYSNTSFGIVGPKLLQEEGFYKNIKMGASDLAPYIRFH